MSPTLLKVLALLGCAAPATAFALPRIPSNAMPSASVRMLASGGGLSLTQPTQGVCGTLGVLGWNYVAVGDSSKASGTGVFGDSVAPPSEAGSSYSETMLPGQRRYVLEGRGTCSAGGKAYKVAPNSLVEAPDGAEVTWTTNGVLIVGTPESDNPARVAARAAVPYVFGGLGAIGVLA
eukprot:2568905-Prymnesium_polylepis.1